MARKIDAKLIKKMRKTITKKKQTSKEKIKKLEERTKKIIRKEKERMKGGKKPKKSPPLILEFVGSFLYGLGDFIRKLEETSPEFRKKIQKDEKEMNIRIRTGWSGQDTRVKYAFSMRPLFSDKEEEKKKRKINILAEVPRNIKKEDLIVYTTDKKLIIESKNKKYLEEIELPFYAKREDDLKYEKGILLIKIKEK